MENVSNDKNKVLLPKAENDIKIKSEFSYGPSIQYGNGLDINQTCNFVASNFSNYEKDASSFNKISLEKLIYSQSVNQNSFTGLNEFSFDQQYNGISNISLAPEGFDKLKWSDYLVNTAASPLWSTESSVSDEAINSTFGTFSNYDNVFESINDEASYQGSSFDFSDETSTGNVVNTIDLIVSSNDPFSQKSENYCDNSNTDNIYTNYRDQAYSHKADAEIVLDSLIKQYINSEAISNIAPSQNSQLASKTKLDLNDSFGSVVNESSNSSVTPTQNQKVQTKPDSKTQTPTRSRKKVIAPRSGIVPVESYVLPNQQSTPFKSIIPFNTPISIKPEFSPSNGEKMSVTKSSKFVRKSPCNEPSLSKIQPLKKIRIEPAEKQPSLPDVKPIIAASSSLSSFNPILSQSKLTNILPRSNYGSDLSSSTLAKDKPKQVLMKMSTFDFPETIEKKPIISTPAFSISSISQQIPISQQSISSGNRIQTNTDQAAAKRQERLIKNRAAALQSRKKRREHMDFLELQVKGLETENANLKKDLDDTMTLLEETRKQLNALKIEKDKNSKAQSVDLKVETEITKRNSSNYLSPKPKDRCHKNSDPIHGSNNWSFEVHSKQNFVGSVIMAVLFSFTMFCIPNSLDSNSSQFGTSSHDMPIQINKGTLSLTQIPSMSGFEMDSGRVQLEDQLLEIEGDNDDKLSGKQIMERVRKSFQEMSRKIVPSQSVPSMFPSELTSISYDENNEDLFGKNALKLVDCYSHSPKSISLTSDDNKIIAHWVSNDSDSTIKFRLVDDIADSPAEVNVNENNAEINQSTVKLILPAQTQSKKQDLDVKAIKLKDQSNDLYTLTLGLRPSKSESDHLTPLATKPNFDIEMETIEKSTSCALENQK
ncbi:Cyclic AMP-dependent transcription factor ATF-6 alpha [Smittium culicis]|uniref:Cyclic AMP-dependent transcription factor ATF-6 alpha n=1 Tax=Smittium culicis TaxID=133412 RepID=A0A1R1XJV7_9FUNG|nr:Cyclic AMP-dependent transcription factor ATF-6 alpha [Smittium culicis]